MLDFAQIWYRVRSRDTRSTTNVYGQGVIKGNDSENMLNHQ